jgi:metal-responsive CopG/Arc/MetJ family transcriptional regulator
MRTHVILADELVGEIDNLVGRRKRSHFVEEAVREKLRRGTLLDALKETAGVLSTEKHPEWGTSKKIAAWVRESRQRDEERIRKLERD